MLSPNLIRLSPLGEISPDGVGVWLEREETILFSGRCAVEALLPVGTVIHITDRRTVLLDARQGGRDELAVGLLRHEWITRLTRRVHTTGGQAHAYLDISVAEANALVTVTLTGAQVTGDSFIRWFSALIAGHRLSLVASRPVISAADEETLHRYQRGGFDTMPPVGDATLVTWAFPASSTMHDSSADEQSKPRHAPRPPGDPEKLTRKAVALADRYMNGGKVATLHRAIGLFRQALEATPEQSAYRPDRLANLARALGELFRESGNLSVQEEVIDLLTQAWAWAPAGDPDQTMHAVNLSTESLERFQVTGEEYLLVLALRVMTETSAVISSADPELPAFHSTFGNVLTLIYERTGKPSLLVRANQAHRDALAALSPAHSERPRHLSSLGATLTRSFEVLGETAYLREAIEVQREVLATPLTSEVLRLTTTVNLSNSLQLLAERTGNQDALTEAVRAARSALQRGVNHPDVIMPAAAALASALSDLCVSTGELHFLSESVEARRVAVAIARGPDRAGALGNLANALSMLYERVPQPSTAAEALATGRTAIEALPEGHPGRPELMSNHALTLMLMHDTTEEAADSTANDTAKRSPHLAEAERYLRQAIALTPPAGPALATYCSHLALVLLRRGGGNLEECVRLARRALDLTPADHPHRCAYGYHLGLALRALNETTGSTSALSEAREVFTHAAGVAAAPVGERLNAVRGLGATAMLQGDFPAALRAYEEAVLLLPQLVSPHLRRSDRERGLGSLSGLAAEAASAAVAAGAPERAVELLEAARGVLLSEALGIRGGLADLRRQEPELAEQIAELRAELDQPPASQDPVQVHQRLARQWRELLTRIRAVPGFGDFLNPPSIADLQPEALAGPIVLVAISDFRGDALVLTPDADRPVHAVELNGLRRQDVLTQIAKLHEAIEATFDPAVRLGTKRDAHLEISAVLAWTWIKITQPVLAKVGFAGEGDLPRIWWCPTGEASFLPLHSAGTGEPAANVLDRAISSYTPTVQALGHARRAATRPVSSALIVTVPEVPGERHLRLDAVAREAAALAEIVPSSIVLTGSGANHRAVVDALPQHRVAHFSCHGVTDWNDPSTSHLVLHDYLAHPLTVAALSRLDLSDADLAFLSACSTSQSNLRLTDEAIHLATGFQLAGFTHVVGTLWPIGDGLALDVAQSFYRALAVGAAGLLAPEGSAHALHDAVGRARERFPQMPGAWAAYVHIGP
ncbi:CHAT domain-containing protein [Nonomuraea typhae]|uniref:CHAT domain-containing protein n=1 Tax=Nonomuraea typhae TaxID=2603600 RepID=UPI0012FA89C7|nr:CHAT domain-containing protein [Nonomuraea typhae]